MRLVIPYHEDKKFTLEKRKSDLENFTTASKQNRNFFVYSPNNLHKFTHTENSTQFQIQRICPILLLLQLMQISVSLAPLGHFHFM
jgi:hypothetical protein